MIFKNKTIIFIMSFIVVSGCATSATDDVAEFRQEAKAHCDVFANENWENVGKNLAPWELQELIRKRVDSAVTSKEMRSILDSMLDVRPENRYSFYIAKLSKLTKEEHRCDNLKNYFSFN